MIDTKYVNTEKARSVRFIPSCHPQIIDKLWDTYGLTPGTAVEHRGQIESVTAGNRKIAELKRKITGLGTPNLGAIEEYARVNERYTYLSAQRDDVLTSKRELESIIRSITQEMTAIFLAEFEKIASYECCHKWWKLMTRYLVTDSPDSAKAKEEPMDEVFHLN